MPGALAVTYVHEKAHAWAVIRQGGRVTEFVWVPDGELWGHVSYEFPLGVDYSPFAISIAPYVLWLVVALTVAVLAPLLGRFLPLWCRSTVFVWGYIVPLADIANAAFPFLVSGAHNDLHRAFGEPAMVHGIAIAGLGLVACLMGYPVQRWIYRERSLGWIPYGVLAALTLVAIAGILSFGVPLGTG